MKKCFMSCKPGRNLYVSSYVEVLYRMGVLMVFMLLTRIAFYFYNHEMFLDVSFGTLLGISVSGGALFDLSAAVYVNLLYIVMRLIPAGFTYNRIYVKVTNWIFGVFSSLALAVNMADIPFYHFTETRTQAVHVAEILQDTGAFTVVTGQIFSYWYVLVPALVFIALFLAAANFVQPRKPVSEKEFFGLPLGKGVRTGIRICLSVLLLIFFVQGMRGFRTSGKPLGVGDYALFSRHPKDVALILNTPFSVIRTLGKDNGLDRLSFFPDDKVAELRNDVHYPEEGKEFVRKNVVMIILEGTGSNYIKAFDRFACERPYYDVPLTPFIDSLAGKSFINTGFYTNMRKSSAGITALLGGFPAYAPFVYMLSPYSGNDVDALARRLAEKGYSSHFFCGCQPGSYELVPLARNFGYENASDIKGYEAAFGTGGEYTDGMWGVYDGPMSEYILHTVGEMPEPFIATWFTLNTHSPFTLPSGFTGSGHYGEGTMERCVEYIDSVLKNFFREASRQDWYDNTLFVITADHCGLLLDDPFYDAPASGYRIPMLFYTPDGSLPAGRTEVISSQIDMSATILDLIGYPDPYFSLGQSIFEEDRAGFALFNSNGVFYCVKDNYILTLSGQFEPSALFDYAADPAMSKDISGEMPDKVEELTVLARTFMQDLTGRIIDNRLKI